jgi:hypothetical protein
MPGRGAGASLARVSVPTARRRAEEEKDLEILAWGYPYRCNFRLESGSFPLPF